MSFGPALTDAAPKKPSDSLSSSSPENVASETRTFACTRHSLLRVGSVMESKTRKQRPQKNAKKFEGLLTSSSEAVKHASLEPPLLQLLALISRTVKTKTKVYHSSSHQYPSAPKDGHIWRKYGQKPLVGTTLTRCALFLARAAPNDHK